MRKTKELKLKEDQYFNPSYLLPDRILNSTEVFTAIHHKKANDIKGKWDESILIVAQKIINLVKERHPYGPIIQEPFSK